MNKTATDLTNEEFLHLLKLIVAFSSQRTLTSITMERSLAIFDASISQEERELRRKSFVECFTRPFSLQVCIETLKMHPLIAEVYLRSLECHGVEVQR